MSTPNPWFDTLNGPKVQAIIEKKGDRLKERFHTDDPVGNRIEFQQVRAPKLDFTV